MATNMIQTPVNLSADTLNFILAETNQKWRNCQRKSYVISALKTGSGFVFANKLEQPESYQYLFKKYYKQFGMLVPMDMIPKEDLNILQQKGCYITDDASIVMCGTQGEMWLMKYSRLVGSHDYVNVDNTPITSVPNDTWFRVRRVAETVLSYKGMILPSKYLGAFRTKSGAVIRANDPNVQGHHFGDVIVVPCDFGGNMRWSELSIVNNTVFALTYDQTVGGWAQTRYVIPQDTITNIPDIATLNKVASPKYPTAESYAEILRESFKKAFNSLGNGYNSKSQYLSKFRELGGIPQFLLGPIAVRTVFAEDTVTIQLGCYCCSVKISLSGTEALNQICTVLGLGHLSDYTQLSRSGSQYRRVSYEPADISNKEEFMGSVTLLFLSAINRVWYNANGKLLKGSASNRVILPESNDIKVAVKFKNEFIMRGVTGNGHSISQSLITANALQNGTYEIVSREDTTDFSAVEQEKKLYGQKIGVEYEPVTLKKINTDGFAKAFREAYGTTPKSNPVQRSKKLTEIVPELAEHHPEAIDAKVLFNSLKEVAEKSWVVQPSETLSKYRFKHVLCGAFRSYVSGHSFVIENYMMKYIITPENDEWLNAFCAMLASDSYDNGKLFKGMGRTNPDATVSQLQSLWRVKFAFSSLDEMPEEARHIQFVLNRCDTQIVRKVGAVFFKTTDITPEGKRIMFKVPLIVRYTTEDGVTEQIPTSTPEEGIALVYSSVLDYARSLGLDSQLPQTVT